MNFEGRVDIALPADKGGLVAVRYFPPVNVSPLLAGKRPEEVTPVISAIYGICANAQAHAAALALEAALGKRACRETMTARALVTATETLRENLLRIALDWPRLLGKDPQGASVRAAMNFVPRMRTALFGDADPFALDAKAEPDFETAAAIIAEAEALLAETVFGEPLDLWLKRRGHLGLLDWSVSAARPAADLIAHLAEKGWIGTAGLGRDTAFFDAETLARLPLMKDLAGHVPETTLYARRAKAGPVASLSSSGLGARFAARLAELALLPVEMRQLLDGDGVARTVSRASQLAGVGVVDAARGLLVHSVRIEDGRVAEYRIVSPTDWNFDANGVAARCLASLDGYGDAEEKVMLAHLVVNAIDPCVAYAVRVH
ncbi:MAG: nickel-dependent hydrogenase large subunit [Oricola sp.]